MAARYHYSYTVSGHGTFPGDMLRYDCAWPRRGESVDDIFTASREQRSIELLSIRVPTVGRWASFGWYVDDVKQHKVG